MAARVIGRSGHLGDTAPAAWRPVPLRLLLARRHEPALVRSVLALWLVFTAAHAAAVAVVTRGAGSSGVLLALLPAVVSAIPVLVWLGPPWAALPVLITVAVAGVTAGAPAGGVVLTALAVLLPLAVVALVCRAAPAATTVRGVGGVAGFAAATPAAAAAGTPALLAWTAAGGLEPRAAFVLWQVWCGGLLVGGLLVAGPLLRFGGPWVRRQLAPLAGPPVGESSRIVTAVAVSAMWAVVAGFGAAGVHLAAAAGGARQPLPGATRLVVWETAVLALVAVAAAVAAAVAWVRAVAAAVTERAGGPSVRDERNALALAGAGDGVWDWDLAGRRLHCSAGWRAMLGLAEDEIGEGLEEWLERVHPEDREQMRAALYAHAEGRTSRFENEHRMRHRDGTYRWMLSRGQAVYDAVGRPRRVVGTLTDISEHRETSEQAQHDALHDTLTALPNRALFMDRLAGAIARTRRNRNHLYAVLFLDLDRFKAINDSMGHAAGDQLLVSIAHRLSECVRPGDTVARLGGDEFAILLDDVGDLGHATEVAGRISDAIARPFHLDAGDVVTSCSIGIASSKAHHERPEDVLRDADTAMYRAKTLGKARHQVFDTAMHNRAIAQVLLEADLRRAVERDELHLAYLPVVPLPAGRVVGLEALLRWRHPARGNVPQGDFLPLAEETGLIVPIGAWVLARACQQLRMWRERFPRADLDVSVNLSGKQLLRADLVEMVAEHVGGAGSGGGRLRLEVTESAILDDVPAAEAALGRLRELGVPVDVDDFGTGLASLGTLVRLPIRRVKVDRGVVAGLPGDERSRALVQAAVAVAHSLGMQVVAEGVESEAQVEALAAAGCDLAQGFLYSQVLDGDEVESYLAERLS